MAALDDGGHDFGAVLLVAGQQDGGIARRAVLQRGQDRGGRALDVRRAEPVGAAFFQLQVQRIGRPPLPAGHRVDVDIQQRVRTPPDGEDERTV